MHRAAPPVLCVCLACGPSLGDATDGMGFESSASGTFSSAEGSSSTGASSSSTTVSGSADAESEGETVGFIRPPDGVDEMPFDCNPWAQDCPRGEKCMPWASDGGNWWNATKCTPIDRDPRAPGESCSVVENGTSGIDDCELGAMCWDVDPETNMGRCVQMCTGNESGPICAVPHTTCVIHSDSALIICLPECYPLLQDCARGAGCYPIDEGFECQTDMSGDGGGLGDPCDASGCDPGLFCAAQPAVPNCPSSDCCATFCDLNRPQCPSEDQGVACVAWYEPDQGLPGLENVGACILPEGG